MSEVAVLLLNYESADTLEDCLRSLRDSDAADCPVVVVDNGSRRRPAAPLLSRWPELRHVPLPHNLGFAGGINAGLAALEQDPPERILILNPDTVVRADFLAPLQRALDEGAAVAGPKLLFPGEPARIWSAGGEATFGLNLSRLRGNGERDRAQFDHAEDLSFLPATVWLTTPAVLRDVGPLDEDFFCYLEDLDWCVRATARGHRLRYEPASVVVHEGSASSGGGYTALRKYLNAHGSWRMLRKHGTPSRWLRFLLCDVLTCPLAFGYGLIKRQPASALWKLRGLWDGLLGRPFAGARRRRLLPEEAT